MKEKLYFIWVFCAGGGQVWERDVYRQFSSSQALLQSISYDANNWATGVSSDFRNYNPSNSKFAAVAATRSSSFDPQKSFSILSGSGRYSTYEHELANVNMPAGVGNFIDNGYRISYLVPFGSRPNSYYWGLAREYTDPIKYGLGVQAVDGFSFYRFSSGNNVVLDQLMNDNRHWGNYNHNNLDNNLLTLSNEGSISKIEASTIYQDNTTNPATPFLFQTHGGIPNDGNSTNWRTDYARDAHMQANSRDTYIIYRPNFGSNVQLPTNVEIMGEWASNRTGERSGS